MDRVANVATPATALTVFVPESVPPPGFVPIAMAMLAVELVTVFPNASCTVTWIPGAIDTPAVAVVGCTVNASLDAAAILMLKALDVAGVSGAEVAVNV